MRLRSCCWIASLLLATGVAADLSQEGNLEDLPELSSHTITEDLPSGEARAVTDKPKSEVKTSFTEAVDDYNEKFGVDEYLVKKESNNATDVSATEGQGGESLLSTDIERELNSSGHLEVGLLSLAMVYLLN